ncbi:MAG: hypothetical protein V3S37_05460 [Dehalococcoidia bacterium]
MTSLGARVPTAVLGKQSLGGKGCHTEESVAPARPQQPSSDEVSEVVEPLILQHPSVDEVSEEDEA